MELHMLFKIHAFVLFVLLMIFCGCGGGISLQNGTAAPKPEARQTAVLPSESNTVDLQKSLDDLAALERSGSWLQGMALAESGLRENAGDYAGAVAAAYKELAWIYGKGLIQKKDIEQGLLNVLTVKNNEAVTASVNAVLAFTKEKWEEASAGLLPYFDEAEEPDGFGRWMILVCALEKNGDDRRAAAAYKSIRARYTQFPEYWYRGARAFSGAVAAEYAENCINIAPQGPFADECRDILAAVTGLKKEDGVSIKTKIEIDFIVSQSVNTGNPSLLEPLLPLVNLPDNPYTVYAVNTLKSLNGIQGFREYFSGKASASNGRLAERLSYISRS
jgi:hypothetical protein